MKRYMVGLAIAGLALVLASGVAYAAAIACAGGDEVCFGTNRADSIKGTDGQDDIRGLGGNDSISGGGFRDKISGGTGADTILGGDVGDLLVGSAIKLEDSDDENPFILRFTDRSNDRIIGGDGGDTILAGFAQDGVDRVESGSGDDTIFASARFDRDFYEEIKVTKEIIRCGPGNDSVQYDAGVDVVDRRTCENLDPVSAGEDTGSRSGAEGRYFLNLE